jgi:hypothetical protein
MADAVVQLLTAQATDPDATTPELTFRPELVVRGSTGPATGRVREAVGATPGLSTTSGS